MRDGDDRKRQCFRKSICRDRIGKTCNAFDRIPFIENNESQINCIKGWVPAELSSSKKPEVKKILPLNPKVDYSIEDKYTCLAAVYYRAKKGVEKYG